MKKEAINIQECKLYPGLIRQVKKAARTENLKFTTYVKRVLAEKIGWKRPRKSTKKHVVCTRVN